MFVRILNNINVHLNHRVQTYLIKENIITRPGASAGLWMSFLLPVAILMGASTGYNVSELYRVAVTVSLGLMGTQLVFLEKMYTGRTLIHVFMIPPVFTYIRLFSFNKIGVWFSIAGGFASYAFSEGVIALLEANPRGLTYGEASVVTQSLILFLFTSVYSIVNSWLLVPIHCIQIATTILQVGLLGVLVICAAVYMFPDFRLPLPFYGLTAAVVFGFVIPLLHVLLQRSPVLWILQLLVADTSMMWLVSYWVVCSMLAVLAVNIQIHKEKQASTVIRKYFHILAVVVFLPGLIMKCCFLYLATGVVLAIFIALELLRLLLMPPFGQGLQAGFSVFADEKDVGSVALTPIYLLVGCSLPLWLFPSVCSKQSCGQHLLPLMSGLLSIGIGDTAASMFGTWIGKTRWKGTKKTKEGTYASIALQMHLVLIFMYLGYIPSDGLTLVKSSIAVVVTSVLEAKTDQVDNVALPLVMYILMLPFSNSHC